MSGLEQQAQPPSSGVSQLVDDYRRQQDAFRKQADDLSRLLERVLATANRESKEILNSAQAEIRRVLVNARRDLMELSAQIESLRTAQHRAGDHRFDEALERASTTMSERRHALHELLREARAGLAAAEPAAGEPPRDGGQAMSVQPVLGQHRAAAPARAGRLCGRSSRAFAAPSHRLAASRGAAGALASLLRAACRTA